MLVIKFKHESSHSFCLERTVNACETAVTVLKLPTNDVKEEFVPLSSGDGSTTSKEKKYSLDRQMLY